MCHFRGSKSGGDPKDGSCFATAKDEGSSTEDICLFLGTWRGVGVLWERMKTKKRESAIHVLSTSIRRNTGSREKTYPLLLSFSNLSIRFHNVEKPGIDLLLSGSIAIVMISRPIQSSFLNELIQFFLSNRRRCAVVGGFGTIVGGFGTIVRGFGAIVRISPPTQSSFPRALIRFLLSNRRRCAASLVDET